MKGVVLGVMIGLLLQLGCRVSLAWWHGGPGGPPSNFMLANTGVPLLVGTGNKFKVQ
jgi:hypothetical protein